MRWVMWLFLAAAAMGSLCASAQMADNKTKVPAASGQSSPSPLAVTDANYVIGSGDALYVSVWKEPDLTATIPVRPDGKISLPLLNDVQAAGLTPMELAGSLTEKLRKYVADPRVTVVVTQVNSQRIFVLGEVQHTGAMMLLPNMTVLQALASAGFSPFAKTKKIYVLRYEHGKEVRIPFNYKQALKGSVAQNILLEPGDTLVVP